MKELFYEQDDVWAQIPEEYQVRVRSDLLAALPRDVQSVLDAGCGDGFVANALPGDLRVTGADISLSALGHVKRDAVRCSVADLPFGDKRFDLVMCNDVLEHLFDDALARALSELERVASRYILVTVPLMENLQAQMTRCGACGAQYHVNRHCRAFGLGRLLSLFSARAIVPESIVFTGARVPAQEEVARGLRAILGMQAEWEKAICPECGARESVGCRDPERIRLVDRLASDPSFSLPSWRPDRNECMALFALGRERKRTTPKKPALRLIRIDGSRNEIEIPFALTDANGNPRLHPDSKAMSEEGALYAEWKTKRVAYRLAIEDIPEDGSIALPAWFSPGALAELESAEPERIAADSRWTRAAVGRILSLMEAEEESASGLTQLRNERDSLSLRLGQYEQLRIDLDNSFAERDALKLRIGQFEQQAVDLQNARAELDTLRLRSGQAEQQAIDLQNARAELDALRSRIGQLEQQASGLESAKAEIDALRARAGQYEQQTVELRNARAELETAHARIAEFEQRAGELRDARAELDSLRARLADLPRLSAELETAKQRLAEVERNNEILLANLGELRRGETELSRCRDDVQRLQHLLEKETRQSATFEGLLQERESRLADIERDLGKSREAADTAQRDLVVSRQLLRESETRTGQMRTRVESLERRKDEADRIEVSLRKVEGERDTARRELASAREELASAQSNAEDARQELLATRSDHGAARDELAAARNALGFAQDQLVSAKAELGGAREELSASREELASARKREESDETYREAERRNLHALQNAYDKTLMRRTKLALLGLGTQKIVPWAAHRESILALVKPSVVNTGWSELARNRRSFLMVCHDQQIDRRIVQQARALRDEGWAGTIVALSFDNDDRLDEVEGIPVHRIGLARIVPDCPVYWRYQNRQRLILWWGRAFKTLSALNWTLYKAELRVRYRCPSINYPLPFDNVFLAAARNYRADLIVAHDLTALPAGAILAEEWQAPLVYDTHEFYHAQKVFSRSQKRIMRAAERRGIPCCAQVVTVNDSIAERLADLYGCEKPAVLLNVLDPPPGFSVDERHDNLREHFGLGADRTVLLFQGGLVRNRNLLSLVEAMRHVRNEKAVLAVMGSGPLKEEMARLCARYRLGDRVFFKDAVAQNDVIFWTASADVGIIPYPAVDLNTYCCTPNKLFEYIQAGVPILANDLPELRRYVTGCGFGTNAKMERPRAIARAIDSWLADPEAIRACRAAIRARHEEFSWKAHKARYVEMIEQAMAQHSQERKRGA